MDKIMKRIRALLDKTQERGATQAEELVALAKARELMAKYKLSEQDFEEKQSGEIFQIELDANMKIDWIAYLVNVFQENFNIMIYAVVRGDEYHPAIMGKQLDVECVKTLFEHSMNFALKNAEHYYADYVDLFGDDKKIYDTYLVGFVDGLKEKYTTQNMSQEYALMLQVDEDVKNKFEEVTKDMDEENVDVDVDIKDKMAYYSGYNKGVNFGTTGIKDGETNE